jgi:hypothetical protein
MAGKNQVLSNQLLDRLQNHDIKYAASPTVGCLMPHLVDNLGEAAPTKFEPVGERSI